MRRYLRRSFRWLLCAASAVGFVLATGNHDSAKAANVLNAISFDAYYDFGSVGSPKLSPDGHLVVYTRDSRIWMIPFAGSVPLASTWNNSFATQFHEGFIRGKIRINSRHTFTWLLMRGNTPSHGCLFGAISGRQEFAIHELPGGGGIDYRLHDDDLRIREGEDWWIEGGIVGNELSMKAWCDGDDEPSSPKRIRNDPTPIGSMGRVGVGANRYLVDGPIDVAFDDIAFTFLMVGDFDFDGGVDGDDFLAWQTGFGTQTGAQKSDGDYDNDGDVDGDNFWVGRRSSAQEAAQKVGQCRSRQ